MSFQFRTAVVTVAAVIIAAAIWWYRSSASPPQSQATSAIRSTTDTRLGVRAKVVRLEVLKDEVFVTGTVLAEDEVHLQAESTGRIVSLPMKEGSSVRKGDLLAKVNDSDLQAQLRRAELNLELARIREARQKQLLETRAISQQDYDIVLNEVNTILAEIDLIKANIDKTEIRAPFDGIVGLRQVSEGTFVTTGTRLATLQSIDRIRIDFSVPERYASQVSTGDVIRFTRQGSDRVYTATVMAIEPRVDANTRTLNLRAVAQNPGRGILPGVFAQITYPLSELPHAILVPSEAVVPELGAIYAYTHKSGVANRTRIETGVRTGTMIQVTRGLSVGDTLLTTGILQLRQGMPVRITNFEGGTP